jgi:DNA-binding NarL/FixJ family response regulator
VGDDLDRASGAVLVVHGTREWPAELVAAVAREGYLVVRIDDVRLVPFFVLAGGVTAILVEARGLELVDGLALGMCRRHSPATAVVAMAFDAAAPTLKRALEHGATVFLSWPAPPAVVAQALRSGRG